MVCFAYQQIYNLLDCILSPLMTNIKRDTYFLQRCMDFKQIQNTNRRKETYYERLWGLEIWGSRQLRKLIVMFLLLDSGSYSKTSLCNLIGLPKLIGFPSIEPVWVIQVNISFLNHISQIFLAPIAAGWESLWGMCEIYWSVPSSWVKKNRITIRQKKSTCCTFITEVLSHFSGKVVKIITVASIWCTVTILDT